MTTKEVQPDELTEDELRAWDWRATLNAQERGIPWLARQTERQQNYVYRIAWGKSRPSLEWLRDVARILNWHGAS